MVENWNNRKHKKIEILKRDAGQHRKDNQWYYNRVVG